MSDMIVHYTSVSFMIEFVIDEKLDTSLFPKYVKVFNYNCTVVNLDGPDRHEIHTMVTARLDEDKVNKGLNETGMKRLKKFLQVMKQHYPDAIYKPYKNGFGVALPEELTAIINS